MNTEHDIKTRGLGRHASSLTVLFLLLAAGLVAGLGPAAGQAEPRDLRGDDPCDCGVEYMLSTGAANGFTPDAIGAADSHWTLVSGPPTVPVGPAYSIDPVPWGVWWTTGGANWINAWDRAPVAGTVYGNNNWAAPPGLYVYELAFSVDTVSYTGLSLDLQVASDNGPATVYLNSNQIGTVVGFNAPSAISSTALQAANILRVEVTNFGSFTGLIVEGGVTGRCLWDDEGKLSIDVSTGTELGVVQSTGDVDPDWYLFSGPGLGVDDAYSIDPMTYWVTSPLANWINPWGGGQYGGVYFPGNNRADSPSGTYTYRLDFFLPPAAIDHRLELNYSADNQVQFYLNGYPIGGHPGPTTYTALHNLVFTDQTKFNPGAMNTLEARVYSVGEWTGLLVEGKVTAACDECHHTHDDGPDLPDLPVDATPVHKLLGI